MCTLGKRCFKARYEVEEILKWKIGMQAADDVKLRHRFAVAGGSGLPCFFKGHGVGPFDHLFCGQRRTAGRQPRKHWWG